MKSSFQTFLEVSESLNKHFDMQILAESKLEEMQKVFADLKAKLSGKWSGEGFAKYPTIDSTDYTEEWEFHADENKDAILFNQKTWYKNNTDKNGKTVFWDTGFILLKEGQIILVSAQVGGRSETYYLTEHSENEFVFDTASIQNDPKTIRSQRIIKASANVLEYELNMATQQNKNFEDHLSARLTRTA
jgi:hypothetical protein